jgi:F-type H+-transporting ATPase subunit delta
VPLTDEERSNLASRLGAALGGKRVAVEDVVDQHLLGGFVAEVGSLIVDGSLDGQLARLRERLARG